MTATRPPVAAPSRAPRRLPRDHRRNQLIEIATAVVAVQGLESFSLDEVAARARVTRNLLYHYFPRGRPDLMLAVGEHAGHELTDGWVTDEAVPLQERMAANFMRFIEHAMEPSDPWRIHRMARASSIPELHAIIERFEDVVIEGVSVNNFGTPKPPPIARLAIKGFIAFSESVLDEARVTGIPREQVLALVAQTFVATLQTLNTISD